MKETNKKGIEWLFVLPISHVNEEGDIVGTGIKTIFGLYCVILLWASK